MAFGGVCLFGAFVTNVAVNTTVLCFGLSCASTGIKAAYSRKSGTGVSTSVATGLLASFTHLQPYDQYIYYSCAVSLTVLDIVSD